VINPIRSQCSREGSDLLGRIISPWIEDKGNDGQTYAVLLFYLLDICYGIVPGFESQEIGIRPRRKTKDEQKKSYQEEIFFHFSYISKITL
jgi:hypothetical protein